MPRKRSTTTAAPRAHLVAAVEAKADARSKSVIRGLAILESFSGEHSLLGIAEVAQIVGFSRSTTHRYMSTLTALGLLVQDRETRRYRLGRRCIDLGVTALEGAGLRDHHDVLERLRRDCSHTVVLAALGGDGAVVADIAYSNLPGQGEMRLMLRVGMKLPLHSTALGRALLAGLDGERLRDAAAQIAAEEGKEETAVEQTLMAHALDVRDAGVSFDEDDDESRLSHVAAPVKRDCAVPLAVGIALLDSSASREAMDAAYRQPLGDVAEMLSSV